MDGAQVLLNNLPDGTDKNALQESLDAVEGLIDAAEAAVEAAQNLYNATEAVNEAIAAAQALAGDVTDSQQAIDDNLHDQAKLLVDTLSNVYVPEGKASLLGYLADAQLLIDASQAALVP